MRPAQLGCLAIGVGAMAALLAAEPHVKAAVVPLDDTDALWIDPVDLEQRDLFRGPVDGPSPGADATFAFVARDTSGRSPGYDVRDANGVVWSVKLGAEAQAEVVASRLLWAIGFHQPPTCYLAAWTMTGQEGGTKEPGRFRPDTDSWKAVGEWNWAEFPLS